MTKQKTKNNGLLGYHESTISLFKSGKRKVSWPLAEKLCKIFPYKSLQEWKRATPEELKQAFRSLDTQNQTTQETMK